MADCSHLFATLLGKCDDKGEEIYQLLFYTGNFDTACGYQGTEEILSDLKNGTTQMMISGGSPRPG